MVLHRLITNLAASAIVSETLSDAFRDALPDGAKDGGYKNDVDDNHYDDNYDGYNDPGDVQPQTDSAHLASFNQVIAICCRLWQHCKCIEHIIRYVQ